MLNEKKDRCGVKVEINPYQDNKFILVWAFLVLENWRIV